MSIDDRPLPPAPERARATPRLEGFAPGQPGFDEYSFGRQALLDANALALGREGVTSAALLYRAALVLFASARGQRQAHRDANPSGVGAPLWLESEDAQAVLAALAPERRQRLMELLQPGSEARLARLATDDLQAQLPLFEQLAIELATPLERAADELRRRQAARTLRRVLAGVLALAAAWGVYGALARENLALNALVTASSAEAYVRANPRALVDGDRKNLGFHTRKGSGESATIDLGALRNIHSVEIYNRFDCCQNRALPLRVELSSDGVSYATVARRTQSFTYWKVELPSTQARFVRLTDEGTNFFHLSEVEVY